MVVAAGCFLCRRRSEKPALKRHETSTEIRKSFHTGNTDTAQNTEILPTPWKTDNSLKCISILGEGTFGKVFKAVNPQNLDNPFVAIKCVDIRKMLKLSCTPGCTTSTTTESNHTSKNVDTNILTTLLNEIDVLSQLSNDHVVRYIDSWAEAEDFSCHKLDRFKLQEYVKSLLTSSLSLPCCILSPYNNIFIRMELCQFTLKYFLVKIDPQNLGIRHVATIFNDVATGLKYIHQKGFIHRDIKPGNLFCKQEQGEGYIWKIGDFGLATRLAEHPDKNYGQLGTKWYWSPEMSRNYSYTTKTDMYSLGLTFLEIVKHGRDEFEMFKLAEKLNVLRSVERSVYLREAVQDKFAPWQKVIAKLVEPEQSKRFDCNKLEVILCNISY
ncbi:mitogen-activated protein kinase 4-like [Folsomia candida]|uniref:mitogen-activated protein kinase 4-like n=1 Tax=Folsomia candida TaxID=158441 RepID=UPI00160523E9|nr:mitogen-activated protein kinase 4-like [Folsomia candida]